MQLFWKKNSCYPEMTNLGKLFNPRKDKLTCAHTVLLLRNNQRLMTVYNTEKGFLESVNFCKISTVLRNHNVPKIWLSSQKSANS